MLAKLRNRLRNDQPAEGLGPPRELYRLRSGDDLAGLARRRERERDHAIAVEDDVAQLVASDSLEPEPLAGKERRPHVEQLVAGRQLELRGRELRSPSALVVRAQRGGGVQRREPRRLALELVDRLRVSQVAEEPDRERSGDEREHENDSDEESREPEAERPEHLGIRVTAYAAGAGVRSEATL